jgi:hypothetical protein
MIMNVITRSELDTILPGALDPKPCALCGGPVYSELIQVSSEHMYGKILCLACEYDLSLCGLRVVLCMPGKILCLACEYDVRGGRL